MKFLGREQRKAVAQIVSIHATEDRQGAGARSIAFMDPVVKYVTQQAKVLLVHRMWSFMAC